MTEPPAEPATPTLSLAVAQPLTLPDDIAANAEAHADAIRRAGARVVVFPELSLTGYSYDVPTLGLDDLRLTPIVEACAETGSVALVGAPVGDAAGRTYISTLAIDGDTVTAAYRKIHLHGDEQVRFTAGEVVSVVDVDGWRLGLAICRDTGFPEHWAKTADLGIDVYAAGILDHAHQKAVPDDRARRIAAEHGVWVAQSSFAGSTGAGYDDALGCSAIWSPTGEIVVQAGPATGEVVRAELTR